MSLNNRCWVALAAAGVVVLFQFASALTPFGGDDVYVLANLNSANWMQRLFAFNLDAPAPEYMPWWTGVVTQRRFIRVPACLLLWLQSVVFGRNAVAYHLFTLAIISFTCCLITFAASRWLSWPAAILTALIPAVHPTTAEIVGTVNCQPLATSGLLSVLAVIAWTTMRLRRSTMFGVTTVGLCALAVMSYEAAIALPLVLVSADVVLWRPPATWWERWGPRAGVLAMSVLNAACSIWMRRDLVTPDTSAPRLLSEIWLSLRLDGVAYFFKAIGLLNPLEPFTYWVHHLVGEPIAVAFAAVLIVGICFAIGKDRVGWLGLAAFFLFLAPPLLTRAAVSRFNLPTLRQIYLPLLLGAPLVAVAFARRDLGRLASITAWAWLALLAVEANVSGRFREVVTKRLAEERSVIAALKDVPAGSTIVGVGEDTCGFAGSFVWAGPALLAIPKDLDGNAPELVAVDPQTFLARAKRGLDMQTQASIARRPPGPTRGPAWVDRVPPLAVTQGWQRIVGATVSVEERSPAVVTSLRYRFDRPLSELAFLRYRGCSQVERLWLSFQLTPP